MADYKAFVQWLGNINDEIKERISEVVEDVTESVCDEAKKIVPVAKVNGGTLKNSIDTMYTTDGLIGYVYTNIHYATYVEKGTYKMEARPYMEQAYEKYYDKFIDELQKLM